MLPMNSRFRSPSPGQAARAVELLGQEIASHLGQTDLRWLTCNERPYLYIPQHRPLACTPPTPKRRLFGDKPAPEFYEETTTLLINYLIGRFTPQVFFDIGAAKGYFARVAASHCAHAPRVHAFEMQPHLHAQLSERLRRHCRFGMFGDCHRNRVAQLANAACQPDRSSRRPAFRQQRR